VVVGFLSFSYNAHMINRIALILGLVAAFFAIVLNLAPAGTAADDQSLALAATIAAVIAGACGVWTFRRGQRFLAIAMVGPAVFVLAESGIRLFMYLGHHAH